MKRLSSILVLALLTVSCSNGTSNSSHPNTEDGLREAATSHFNTFIKSPMNTYQFLSKDCQSAVSKSEYNGQMLMASGMFESFLGVKLSDVKIGAVVTSNFSPGSGEVSIELLGPDGEQITDSSDATKYVYEDGGWRTTDCESSSDDSGDTSSPVSETTFDGELRPADEIKEEELRSNATMATIGEAISFDDLDVLISSISYYDDVEDNGTDDDYRISLELRVENRTSETKMAPSFNVSCMPDGQTSSWYVDSTYDMYEELPTGSFLEGNLILGVPVGCNDPVVRLENYDAPSIDWAVPTDAQSN
jgi:hypothetical protein